MESKSLKLNSLNTEFSEDIEFNIEEVEQIIAPQIDSSSLDNNTTGDETIGDETNGDETTGDETTGDGDTKGGGIIKSGTTVSCSRKSWCC